MPYTFYQLKHLFKNHVPNEFTTPEENILLVENNLSPVACSIKTKKTEESFNALRLKHYNKTAFKVEN